MNFDQMIQIAGLVGTIGPLVVPMVPTFRKWLFVEPTPVARASLAGLGGLFGAGMVMLFLATNPLVLLRITNGEDILAVNSETKWADAHAKCSKGVAVSAYCYTTSGFATLVKSGVDNGQAHCAWINPQQNFQGRIRAICLQSIAGQ